MFGYYEKCVENFVIEKYWGYVLEKYLYLVYNICFEIKLRCLLILFVDKVVIGLLLVNV